MYTTTKQQFIAAKRQEYGQYYSDSMLSEIITQHYNELSEAVKKGDTIDDSTYASLDSMQKYHFDKHYNYRGDKVKVMSHEEKWDEAMNWWKSHSTILQQAIRRTASDKLVEQGAEEVGSSDVNHAVFQMYQEYKSSGNPDIVTFLMNYIN